MYESHKTHDFVGRTQIMNEGWAMYWEKKIMMELFKENTVNEIIDYSVKFSGVCYPRPWFMRNPYHLGYNMWLDIEEKYKKGQISLEFSEEKNRTEKENWNRNGVEDPIKSMEHLVSTITDYEFIRRFLDNEMIERFHLNRLSSQMAQQIQVDPDDIVKMDDKHVWINPEEVKKDMLEFFVDFHRPMVYIIDDDFIDGGLLLYHRHKGRDLREDWIEPTLKNIRSVWKSPVYLISNDKIYKIHGKKIKEEDVTPIDFDDIREKMSNNEKPFKSGE